MILYEIFDILKYILPSLIVFGVTYFLIRSFLQNEQKKLLLDIKLAGEKVITPIRLQAYERIVMYLERISPNNLILRTNKPGMTALQLKTALIAVIRDEFEHNLSQQIYISIKAWEYVKNAKEEMIKLINTTSGNMEKDKTGADLATKLFEHIIHKKRLPVDVAIEFVKTEINQRF